MQDPISCGKGKRMLTHVVTPEQDIRLADIDPDDTAGLKRADADQRMPALNQRLTDLQEMHYASGKNAILIILQGLDAAGKDGTVKHVVAQFNPAGCRVESFKVPTPLELAHDFLWRIHQVTPALGDISVFNRSHYEDVLVARVHHLVPEQVWESRYDEINNFERLLAASGTIILKFFLYISKAEQKARLLARERDKDKAWKLSTSDWPEHARYDEYVAAYDDALRYCSTTAAPWYLVPADHKWFRDLAVAQTIVDRLEPLASEWRQESEERGRENVAARDAQRKAGIISSA